MSNYYKPKFAYMAAIDISIDNGSGINEREFVSELIRHYGDEIVCVLPYPGKPENYYNEKIEYVINHKRHQPFFWLAYEISSFLRIVKLNRKYKIKALVFRLDIIPLVEFLLCYLRIPIMLKTLAGGTFKAKKTVQVVKDIGTPVRKRVMKLATAVDAVGEVSKKWVNETYGISENRIAVIPNAANIDFFIPGSQSESRSKLGLTNFKKIVGYVGALRKISCIDILINSFSKIDDESCLVFVGDGPERSELETLASELRIHDKVYFIGNVPYSEVPCYIRAFDVAIDLTASPIKIKNKTIKASYSQKIAQYLACGIPVIAWNLEDTVFLEKNKVGQVIEYGNDNELIKAIMLILNLNKNEKLEYAFRARRYAETKLSFEHLVKKRVEFWRNMT